MAVHLSRGVIVIAHPQDQPLLELEDQLASDYAFEEWAIEEEAGRFSEDQLASDSTIVMVFYAYDVERHLAWARQVAEQRHGALLEITLASEPVAQADYERIQALHGFATPYRRAD
jgi:hypothetical protein